MTTRTEGGIIAVFCCLSLLLLTRCRTGQGKIVPSVHVPVVTTTSRKTYRYNICNGLSNQLLYHAGSIATAIRQKYQEVDIPDHFIVNGVQNSKDDVLPNPSNSIPFGEAFDKAYFLEQVEELGIRARLVPLDFTSSRKKKQHQQHYQQECAGMASLHTANPSVVLHIMKAFKPSKWVQSLVETVQQGFKSRDRATGVCLHHRDGHDWYNHCARWEKISDGIYRGNCRALPGRSLVELLEERGLSSQQQRSWIYYCGDHNVPKELKDSNYDVLSRNELLSDEDLQQASKTTIGSMPVRDLWALVDFFVCRSFHLFIGNSVSTFSAVQIALRDGENSYWYNSKSIPLGGIWRVYQIPIVYTFTELSQSSGRHMLQTSIISVQQHMRRNKIHILYHGNKDLEFKSWLKERGVIIHQHDPAWKDAIEKMRLNGDPVSSHLFAHAGNYFGTWQRIDIPNFIDSEYCLLLDADTLVLRRFTMQDFGPDLTLGLAMSSEMNIGDAFPSNAGVTLFNVPFMRRTYQDFLDFILAHIDTAKFDHPSPGDQGAYLDFYRASTQFLSARFNYKPYWKLPEGDLKDPFLLHFHGVKPHDYLKYIFGENCDEAIQFLCARATQLKYLCPSIQAFAKASKAVDPFAYCESSFSGSSEALLCNNILDSLVASKTQCTDLSPVIRKELNQVPARFSLAKEVIESKLSPLKGDRQISISTWLLVIIGFVIGGIILLSLWSRRIVNAIAVMALAWTLMTFKVSVHVIPKEDITLLSMTR